MARDQVSPGSTRRYRVCRIDPGTIASREVPCSKLDFDNLRRQIAHRDTQVFKDEGKWFRLVNNPCTHLQADGRCGIYPDMEGNATRPPRRPAHVRAASPPVDGGLLAVH
ncbi:MAG: hypothetical protein PVF51_03485 [Nitrospirota bacterium]|jgi:hypothetical protein